MKNENYFSLITLFTTDSAQWTIRYSLYAYLYNKYYHNVHTSTCTITYTNTYRSMCTHTFNYTLQCYQ